jgi:hypothetical protein
MGFGMMLYTLMNRSVLLNCINLFSLFMIIPTQYHARH